MDRDPITEPLTNETKNQEYLDLFRSHENFLIGVAFRFAPRPDLVPDIIQQAFVRFLERAAKKPWNLEIETRPLLYTITKSIALDYWRAYEKENEDALVRIGGRLRQIQSENEHKEAIYEQSSQRIHALKDCMKKLPAESAALLEEHYDHGISINAIAARLQIDATRLRKIFSRLRAKLKECILKFLHE